MSNESNANEPPGGWNELIELFVRVHNCFNRSALSPLLLMVVLANLSGCALPRELAPAVMTYPGLPNFDRVDAAGTLYRGAQPKNIGIQQLARLHIKTIIDLLPDRERSLSEADEAARAKITYRNSYFDPKTSSCVRIEMNGFLAPKIETVERVLAIIDKPANQPVFVHCTYGKDRTGTIIACYRIEHGWSAQEAIWEADRYSMSPFESFMRSFIRSYAKSHSSPKTSEQIQDLFAPQNSPRPRNRTLLQLCTATPHLSS